MSCLSVTSSNTPPWAEKSAIAAASVGAVTLVATGILALLVSSGTLALPFSINTVFITGISTSMGLFILGIVLKLACSKDKTKKDADEQVIDGKQSQNLSSGVDTKGTTTNTFERTVPKTGENGQKDRSGKETSVDGHSPLNPGGNTGAKGGEKAKKNNFRVTRQGDKHSPLST